MGGAWSDSLARRGLNVVVASNDAPSLGTKCRELEEKYGVETRGVEVDLASKEMFDVLQAATDDLEIGFLVYNAGFADLSTFAHQTIEHELLRLDLNCRGPLILSHYFGKKMLERERGGVVIMSSMGGLMGNPYNAGYAATKAFDYILAEGLWYEFGLQNVDVLGVLPGLTKTHENITDDSSAGTGGKPMEPEAVVEEALAALGKQPTVAPGRNRFLRFLLTRLMPRVRAIRFMAESYEKNWPELIDG